MKNKAYCENKTKIALPYQYSISFPNNREVLSILVFIKLHIGNDMDQVHYVCDYWTTTQEYGGNVMMTK